MLCTHTASSRVEVPRRCALHIRTEDVGNQLAHGIRGGGAGLTPEQPIHPLANWLPVLAKSASEKRVGVSASFDQQKESPQVCDRTTTAPSPSECHKSFVTSN